MMHHLLLRQFGKVAVTRSGCADGQHYYVKRGGSWVCTMCGDTR